MAIDYYCHLLLGAKPTNLTHGIGIAFTSRIFRSFFVGPRSNYRGIPDLSGSHALLDVFFGR